MWNTHTLQNPGVSFIIPWRLWIWKVHRGPTRTRWRWWWVWAPLRAHCADQSKSGIAHCSLLHLRSAVCEILAVCSSESEACRGKYCSRCVDWSGWWRSAGTGWWQSSPRGRARLCGTGAGAGVGAAVSGCCAPGCAGRSPCARRVSTCCAWAGGCSLHRGVSGAAGSRCPVWGGLGARLDRADCSDWSCHLQIKRRHN